MGRASHYVIWAYTKLSVAMKGKLHGDQASSGVFARLRREALIGWVGTQGAALIGWFSPA